jgi:predicted site-specific integrase-resolvase
MDPVAQIKAIYQRTSPATIARDLERAIALLKTLATEEERERAAVYMDGLSQMRSEWKAAGRKTAR